MSDLPELALAVIQPWAWAIIYAGKDIENRSHKAVSFMVPLTGRRAIHASKGMTRDEYAEGKEFLESLGIACPAPHELQRGGIIGSVEVRGAVRASASRWFFGPVGLVLREPRPCAFIPARGALGYFKWRSAVLASAPDTPRWMVPRAPAPVQAELPIEKQAAAPDLFGGRE
jgi:hypothetical protein